MQSPAWNNFIVDDRRRYVYCKVGQVAYSSWKRTLLNLADGVADARQLSFDDARGDYTGTFLRLLSSYAPDEIDHRLKTYFKFMFVRHPFERLVSAYRNRVARETGHQSPKQEESQPTK